MSDLVTPNPQPCLETSPTPKNKFRPNAVYLLPKENIMLTRAQSAIFLSQFHEYFGEHTIASELDTFGRLIIFTNPYLKFDELLEHICENIFDIYHFAEHFEILIYPFGSNDYILISINNPNKE